MKVPVWLALAALGASVGACSDAGGGRPDPGSVGGTAGQTAQGGGAPVGGGVQIGGTGATGAGSDAGGAAGNAAGGSGPGGGSPSGGGGGPGTGGAPPIQQCPTSVTGTPRLRRLSRRELTSSLEAIFPEVTGQWTPALSADTVTAQGFDNDAASLLVGKQTAGEIADTAEALAAAVTGDAVLSQILPCASTTPDATCAGQFFSTYGRRLFRRPLTQDEITSYGNFFNTALAQTSDFERALGWMLRGLIESPHFIYRREIGTLSGAERNLNQYEIATELAYTYTGTTPTDALLQQADAGLLGTRDALITAATELLNASGRDPVHHFLSSWLGYERVTTVTKAAVPEFLDLREQMREETRQFIDEIVFAQGGGPRELLTAPFTTPSTALASFYGLTAPASDYAMVQRPAGQGIGLLAQGSLLAALASPDRSSPTKRGLLVYERMLCQERPTVPADVPMFPDAQPGVLTTRQRAEQQHTTPPQCAGCHSAFDPIGFGFEHFDEAGRYRDQEFGLPIDSESAVPGPSGTLFEFQNLEELATGLATLNEVHLCISAQLSTYVFGASEACLGETRRGDFVAGDVGFLTYLASLAGEPHFASRRAQ